MFKNQVMNKMLCQSGYLNIVGEVSLPNSRIQSLGVNAKSHFQNAESC